MRIWLSASLLLLTADWFVVAQPPAGSPSDTKFVIRPGGNGIETVRPGDPLPSSLPGGDEKAGFIVIRPGGKGITFATTQTAQPKQPIVAAPQTAPGILNVPPPGPQPVATKGEKPLFDYWFAVGVEGQRVGYVNWAAKETEKNGKSFAVGVRYLNLTVARFGTQVTQWGEESTVESSSGDVLITSMRQGLGKDQALALTGIVEGKTLKIKGEGAAAGASDTPWPEGVVGLVREPKLFQDLKLKVGESHEYPSYIPTVNRVVKTTLTYEGEETKVLWDKQPARKLLRFGTKPEPIGKVKLPASTTWVDAETFEPLMMETDFPALGGRLTFLRTTKEAASAPVTRPVEVFNVQSIRLDREIPGIHGKGSVVYKMAIPRDDDPASVFATDTRQVVKNLDEKTRTFEFHVSASHGPEKNVVAQPAPGKEFLGSSFFINWDNDAVKGHAAKAIAGLPANATAWDKAVAVERWVKANMKAFEFSQAMATADAVAKNLSGDCTEYAMLSAAMCRAVGVPSRTALGVVYAPGQGGKPFLAYHMWFEVFAGEQWVPLDATLGLGGVGPGHVKITDHSWHEERSFAPLLPVLRALTAKPTVQVLKVNP
ncbi:MAG: transglutaminase-like domain-containing protein [Gemmataceae bacterium]